MHPLDKHSRYGYGSVLVTFVINFSMMALTIFIAYGLSILPSSLWSLPLFYTYELRLPAPFNGLNHYNWLEVASLLKPQWTLLMVIYWAIARPSMMGVGLAWLVGLGLDILQEGLLGEYAMVFSIVCYFTLKMRWRFLQFSILQQMMLIVSLLLLSQFLIFWIQSMIGHPPVKPGYWLASVGGMIIWPLLVILLPKPER